MKHMHLNSIMRNSEEWNSPRSRKVSRSERVRRTAEVSARETFRNNLMSSRMTRNTVAESFNYRLNEPPTILIKEMGCGFRNIVEKCIMARYSTNAMNSSNTRYST